MALLRRLRRPQRAVAAHRQLPAPAERADGPPHLADQHRPLAPRAALGVGPGLPRPGRALAPPPARLRQHHPPGALPGAPLQLVRDDEPPAAAAALRLHGGQRQLRRLPPGPQARLPRRGGGAPAPRRALGGAARLRGAARRSGGGLGGRRGRPAARGAGAAGARGDPGQRGPGGHRRGAAAAVRRDGARPRRRAAHLPRHRRAPARARAAPGPAHGHRPAPPPAQAAAARARRAAPLAGPGGRRRRPRPRAAEGPAARRGRRRGHPRPRRAPRDGARAARRHRRFARARRLGPAPRRRPGRRGAQRGGARDGAPRARRPRRRGGPRHGLHAALRHRAQALPHRVQRHRRPARLARLRSAGLGGAAGQLRGHHQARRAGVALVRARPPADQPRRRPGAPLVGRHDVRVPHAGAVDAQPAGHAPGAHQRRRGGRAAGLGRSPRRALGRLGVGLRPRRRGADLPVPLLRGARPRPQAGPRGGPGHHPLRLAARGRAPSRRGGGQRPRPRGRGHAGPLRPVRGPRPRPRACGAPLGPAAGDGGALVHGPPPGDDPRRPEQPPGPPLDGRALPRRPARADRRGAAQRARPGADAGRVAPG